MILPTLLLSAFTLKDLPAEEYTHSVFDSALYAGASVFLGGASLLGGASWAICRLLPGTSTPAREFLLTTQILGTTAFYSFTQALKKSPISFFFRQPELSSYSAWQENRDRLAQVPIFHKEDQELLHFLQRRWLSKVTGCFPFLVKWICPSFGISFQVHPETTNSYARDPATKLFETYKNRVEAWKLQLPHPYAFPLILTRPVNIGKYLPSYLEMHADTNIQESMQKMGEKFPVVIDLTPILQKHPWSYYENQLAEAVPKLDLSKIICVERLVQNNVGGLRLLPFSSLPPENEENYRFLFEWISRFGLGANRVELDRLLPTVTLQPEPHFSSSIPDRQEWISFLESIKQAWHSNHPQKTFLFKGTLQLLKDLCTLTSPEKWEAVVSSSARSSLANVCFKKIKEQLLLLTQEEESTSFHVVTTHLERIHADISSLLAIFIPFTLQDFIAAFKHHQTCIPPSLHSYASYSLHTSSMTSLAGIFKATHILLGKEPKVLYGNNLYFECGMAAERVSQAVSILEATEQEWKDVDLILAQFNPTVKRISFKVTEYQTTEYRLEHITDILHKALGCRGNKPLVIAIDETLDFSNSSKIEKLLLEFQEEIKEGRLNVICYRSGLKFDLFGMDNYCGAPFYMLHNQDPIWDAFDLLLTDPVLQTDSLSLNWFSLAYQNAAPFLELYRQQIFSNTRAVLDKIPPSLFHESNTRYRVIPVEKEAEPTFIDIKIFGPSHKMRGSFLIGVFLTIKCMEAGYPLLYRPGIGFYHPNLAVLYGEDCTTVRLTVGLDPAQVDVIAQCLEKINSLTHSAL